MDFGTNSEGKRIVDIVNDVKQPKTRRVIIPSDLANNLFMPWKPVFVMKDLFNNQHYLTQDPEDDGRKCGKIKLQQSGIWQFGIKSRVDDIEHVHRIAFYTKFISGRKPRLYFYGIK